MADEKKTSNTAADKREPWIGILRGLVSLGGLSSWKVLENERTQVEFIVYHFNWHRLRNQLGIRKYMVMQAKYNFF